MYLSRITSKHRRHPSADVSGACPAVRSVRLQGPHRRGLRRRLLRLVSRGGVHRGTGATVHGHQGHAVRGPPAKGRGPCDGGARPACLPAVRGLWPTVGEGAAPEEQPQAGQVRSHVRVNLPT